MVESPTLETTDAKPAKRHTGGPYPKITLEIITRIAERRRNGTPLRRCCVLENPPFPFSHLQEALQRSRGMALAFEQKESESVEYLLGRLQEAPPGQWQKVAWILERCFPQEFGTQKAQTIVNNNVVLGLEEQIRQRAALYARDLARKEFPKAKIIDVTSEPSAT